MKRFLCFCIILGIICSSQLFAQAPKFSAGGGIFFSNYIHAGGSGDFAFLIYNKKYDENSLDIRNHFVLRGAGFDSGSLLTISEKISFGSLIGDKFRSYGYMEGGIGLWGNDEKEFFELPLVYTIGGGGGTDIFLSEKLSIYFEAGVLINVLDNDWKTGGLFQMGWRRWF
jgi:hypothetical protein